MDSPYSPLEFSLLNAWQRDFPLVPRPFAKLAQCVTKVGAGEMAVIDETAVLATLKRLSGRGAISRVGAVFAPRRVGAGALAALAAPAERLEEVAALINACPLVNHNYQREHHYNLWFVVTASDKAVLAQTLAAIAAQTACPVIAMPLAEEFHIDLGFDLRSGHSPVQQNSHVACAPRELDAAERKLAGALQDGLQLCPAPYAELGVRAGLSEAQTIDLLQAWQDEGLVKRFGVVVRHHELGYRANAMVVFDVPDAQAGEVGALLAREQGVTLCYRRERCLPAWRYNLYCMVHGRGRSEVAPVVDRLAQITGVVPTVLFSVRRFKQCGARYFQAPHAA